MLLKNCTALLSYRKGFELENMDIRIRDIRIEEIASNLEPLPEEIVRDIGGDLVIPGLINAHTHAPMIIFRGYADDIPFEEWLFGKILPAEMKLTDEIVYWATLLACAEMIKTGTTSFVDMYSNTDAIAEAVEKIGMRGFITQGLTDTDNGGNRRLEENISLMRKWNDSDRIKIGFGPHSPYTCSPDYLKEIVAKVKEEDSFLTIHLFENAKEREMVKETFGVEETQILNESGIYDVPCIAAHCVHVNDEDILALSKNNVSVVHDPSSNMKLANGIAPIVKMYNEGINICLGTDGAASNNSLNLWNEIRLAALVHKAITQDPTVMSAPQILKMATENGAKALGMSNSLGRIEKDMLADLVVLDLDALSFHPPNDIISDLAYSTNGSEVKDVIANGKFIMKDREILTIDIQEVKSRIDEYAGQICV